MGQDKGRKERADKVESAMPGPSAKRIAIAFQQVATE